MSRLFTSAVTRRSDQHSNLHIAAEEFDELEDAEEEEFDEEQGHDEHEVAAEDAEEGPTTEEVVLEGPRALEKLLNSDHAGAYDQIFQVWTALEPSLKDKYMTDVMLAISASTRPIEAWRVIDLFVHPVDQWTEDIARAAVKAHLTLHNVSEAMSIFKTALEQRGFGRALDHIVAYGFELASWDLVLQAWELYYNIKGEEEPAFESPALTTAEPVAGPYEVQGKEEGAELTQHQDGSRDLELTPIQEMETVSEPDAETEQRQDVGSGTETLASQETAPAISEVNAGTEQPEDVELAIEPSTSQMTERNTTEKNAEAQQLQSFEPGTESPSSHEAESVSGAAAMQEAEAVVDSTPVRDVDVVGGPAIEQTPELMTDSLAAQRAHPSAEPAADSLPEQSEQPLLNSTHGYSTLAATANFEAKVNELYQFLESDPETLQQRTALVDSFLRHIVRSSMHLFQPSDVVFMLHRAPDPRSYERYIIFNVEQGHKKLASDLFRKYRALPGVRMAVSVLRVMIDIFFPHNVVGMETLLEDWYRYHGRLDERAYRKFMAFYGGRGDVKSIMQLAREYAKCYNRKVEGDPKFITTLMQAHAVRGDPDAAHQVMVEAAERTGEPPDIKRWNILMNAHAKAGDYEGAIDLFSYICDALEPDDYTFGTMMGMAGFRGDLQFTLELYQLSIDRGVKPSLTMVRALVEAYCQNDQFKEAERLCIRLTKRRDLSGDYTLLWNALLHHNAKRRDLATVNRLLEFMTSQGVAYNQDTYSHLLLALLYARQSHHAMHLLRVAHHEGVFEPTADHFILLMAAFINTGEPHMVLKTNQLMSKLNLPQSAMRMTKVIDALGRWQQLPYSKRRGAKAEDYMRKILSEFHKSLEREDQGSPDDVRSIIGLYSKVLFILTQMREYVTVQQLIRLHNSRYPNRAGPDTVPLRLLHQMMLADFHEKKFDRVKETWRLVLYRATKRYQPASAILGSDQGRNPDQKRAPDQEQTSDREQDPEEQTPLQPVLYAQRFRLCDPLKTMQRLYLEEQNADALLKLIATVRERGFDLDSKNWNYHVQALARLKRWREAFTVCEKVLMPQWTGWYSERAQGQVKNQIPLELRRVGLNPARPRPISHTLLVLAKEYMDLEQMSLWSREASREFKFITEECPKTIRAVTTMHEVGSRLERQVVGEDSEWGWRPSEDEIGEAEEEGEREKDKDEVMTWRGGRLVRPNEKRRFKRPARYRDVWTDGGFLNARESSPEENGGMSEEDIVNALKAGPEEEEAGRSQPTF
jgi:pentatricopeptide repeat-containing protein PET309